jgi:hypothetical protein
MPNHWMSNLGLLQKCLWPGDQVLLHIESLSFLGAFRSAQQAMV